MAHFADYSTSDPNAAANGWTALAANGTVTVGPIQTEAAQNITGSVFSDQAGSYVVQQSEDGVDWDITSTSVSVTANVAQPAISVPVVAPQAQLVFTNNTTAQTVLRIFIRAQATGKG